LGSKAIYEGILGAINYTFDDPKNICSKQLEVNKNRFEKVFFV